MLVPPQSLHCLLWRLCWQMPVPPQSLQALLMRLCGQMLAPPQSLHLLLWRLCWQMLVPPQSLQSALVTLGAQATLPHEVGLRVKRRWQNFGQGLHACVVTCGGVVAVLAVNENAAAATFEVEANVKVMIARTAQGLLANDDKAAEHLNAAGEEEEEEG